MIDRRGTNVLWLKKEELKQAREYIAKIEPWLVSRAVNVADLEIKQALQGLKTLLNQEKQIAKPKTYCFTGIVKEKLRDKLSKKSKTPGAEFYRLTLDNKVVFYAFQHELDDLNDYQNKVLLVSTGEKWELEGHRWVADKYYLRKLRKIES